jgi:hypothetical protein
MYLYADGRDGERPIGAGEGESRLICDNDGANTPTGASTDITVLGCFNGIGVPEEG